MPTAVFLDLDGTFWEAGVVPESAVRAIRAAQANGHKVLTNTGRTRAETRSLAEYGLDGFCFGAGSEVILHGEHVVDERLGVPVAHQLEDHLRSLRLNYLAEGSEQCYRYFFEPELLANIEQQTAEARALGDPFLDCPEVSEMDEAAYQQVYKYSIFCAEPTSAATVPGLPQGFTFTPLDCGGEITKSHVTKASAMEAVRAALGSEWRTAALGDSNNDLPMLRAADVGICMGNGNDAAKAAADWVTTPIHEDGLLHAFEHLGLV